MSLYDMPHNTTMKPNSHFVATIRMRKLMGKVKHDNNSHDSLKIVTNASTTD